MTFAYKLDTDSIKLNHNAISTSKII